MSRWLAAVVGGLMLVAATPRAQDGMAGDWDFTIDGPEGVVSAAASLKQDGETLTGQIQIPQGDSEVAGTIKGHTLLLAFVVNMPSGALNVTMTGEVDGDAVKGTLDYGMGTAPFTGKKK